MTNKPNFKSGTIWTGDNLDIMRGINSKCIDLIYLDPPFNSNRNYSAPVGSQAAGAAFKDAWYLSDIDKCEHGELAERNPAAYSVIQTAGVCHSKGMKAYLIYMAVRLLEMERILKSTGSIYLHCDDTAGAYLKLLMDAVFGRKHFVNSVIWNYTGGGGKCTGFPRKHDTILYYTNGDKYTFNKLFTEYAESTVKRFNKEDEHGRYKLTIKSDGTEYKTYMKSTGKQMPDVWPINILVRSHNESTGYPTQKPLALLERIIKASSNEGDMVFDPFCGCATTCVAASRLQREWIGCDLSELAVQLVNERISEDQGLFRAIHPDVKPKRTDTRKLPNYRTHAHHLYGEQEGICEGCNIHFPFGGLTVDHKLPKSRGGQDHLENLQLLCTRCNSSKGSKTMPEWNAVRNKV